MQRLTIILGILSVVALILFFLYREGEKKGIANEINKQQEQQIQIQNEIIQEKKQIQIRKTINKTVPTSDNIEWLRENRCKDCKSK